MSARKRDPSSLPLGDGAKPGGGGGGTGAGCPCSPRGASTTVCRFPSSLGAPWGRAASQGMRFIVLFLFLFFKESYSIRNEEGAEFPGAACPDGAGEEQAVDELKMGGK